MGIDGSEILGLMKSVMRLLNLALMAVDLALGLGIDGSGRNWDLG